MSQPETIRIAVTGPESTGKSELTKSLSLHFHAATVEEFARDYVGQLNRPYKYEDILFIAQQQVLNEDRVAANTSLIFCDTELLVTKIWCEVKYNQCHPWILNEMQRRKYDLVLLCNTDLPWEEDPLREHPHMRPMLMNLYREQATQFYPRVAEIRGLGPSRTECAIQVVRDFLLHHTMSV